MPGFVAVLIIAVIFCVLAGGILYGAWKGKFKSVSDALGSKSRAGSKVLVATLVVVYVGFGVVLPLVFILGNHSKSNAQVGGIKLTASMQSGRELFADHCAVCHTLAADNAVGKTGPNFDTLKPSEGIILHTIENGCLQQPPAGASDTCLGYGTMPAGLLQGRQAQDVAAFVSRVAGHA